MKDANKEELTRIIEAGMQHKADLTKTIQSFNDTKQEKEHLIRHIQ